MVLEPIGFAPWESAYALSSYAVFQTGFISVFQTGFARRDARNR
jgi:hypothetical protein